MNITQNKVRMHDTDMAGILYFPKIYRFVHEGLEDLTEKEGFDFEHVFHQEDFVFVIVHSEADYKVSMRVGDLLEVHTGVEHIGNTSFTMLYKIYRSGVLTGVAKTIHCCVSAKERTKIPVPLKFRAMLEKYLIDPSSEK
jgi:1,4-dihydroxy-2-naphthoyl-CoA hydrolase